MKTARKNKKLEPTLRDVIGVIESSSGRVEKRLDKVERRLDGVEQRLSLVENRVSGVEDTSRHLLHRVGEVEGKLDEVQESLGALSGAFDRDAEVLLDYGKRIVRLEKARA